MALNPNGGNVGIGTTNPARLLDVNGHISAATAYQINGSTVLASPGNNNFLAGVGAGNATMSGASNSFIGKDAGLSNTSGGGNAFAGYRAGWANTTGGTNSFFCIMIPTWTFSFRSKLYDS